MQNIEIIAFIFFGLTIAFMSVYIFAKFKLNKRAQFLCRIFTAVSLFITGVSFTATIVYSNVGFSVFMFFAIIMAFLADVLFGLKNIYKNNRKQFMAIAIASFFLCNAAILWASLFSIRLNLAMIGFAIGLVGIVFAITTRLKFQYGKMIFPIIIYMITPTMLVSQGIYMLVECAYRDDLMVLFVGIMLYFIANITMLIKYFKPNYPAVLNGVCLGTYYVGFLLIYLSMFFM